ncbi:MULTISPECIES: cytochrome d ubiquinol oxidase subunit II [unclassified Schaalia]|uniref:cytochrome d ubiquinol oxidase subunit II n=1 Tax=unclassified Schaalia TaxID=2691889 RepID=UPI001E40AA02|nr:MULTISPECIES: cytochrome d ubiquinol oxidase subunit II [unclassified Schaalia]MCD4549190.1 cytochrome d ubiquinol oxidase subunit II [Schaalia sp. lx-260]MCD4557343.1 cytochrome d ubiquinol oxidase subunit II [Schaalia sp. lx-100]
MTLSILWFILIAVLWTMYLVLEGFDFGVGVLSALVARDDRERTQVVRTIGPHWDGNEVWLLTAGGATFAAFPEWYATMFSGMYLALFLVLVCLILRITALEWRSKIATATWRTIWDRIHTVCAALVPVLLGVAFANLVQGMAIEVVGRDGKVVAADKVAGMLDTSVHQLTGGFFSLLTPYTILGGVVVLAICLSHGAQFLALKTEGPVRERSNTLAGPLSLVATLLAAVWVIWGQFVYVSNVFAWIPLAVAAICLILSAVFSQSALRSEGKSFLFSALAIAAAVTWIFSAMAPAVMKSYINPAYSLTIDQASSTTSTLTVMTIVAVCFVPVVLIYVAWSYWVFRHRVSINDIEENAGLLPKKIRLGQNFLAG